MIDWSGRLIGNTFTVIPIYEFVKGLKQHFITKNNQFVTTYCSYLFQLNDEVEKK